MRIDGANGTLAFNNMSGQGPFGTTDWKEYSITLPYDDDNALTIYTGALLVGSGKMWMDDLRLYIDGKPVEKATMKQLVLSKAQADTAYSKRSRIDTIMLNKQQLTNLTLLGQAWGFLKYHHPAVAQGNYNMDAELFRVMPAVLKAHANIELSKVLESWVDKFGTPAICKKCKLETGDDIAQRPDYGSLFDPTILSSSLIGKLKYVLNNRNTGDNYYIDMARNVGNPIFQHELPYNTMSYPDAGYRMLSLYRYWNIIQYFYPYKHLIGRNWDEVLPEYIARFAGAANQTDYALISSIHDTHANIWSNVPALEVYRGTYTFPFQAKFIQNRLTVTGYYADTLNVKQKVKVGDVISSIDGVSVEELIKKYLPITAASNYATQLRDMPRTYLLRTNKKSVTLAITNDGKAETVTMETVERRKLNTSIDYDPDPKAPGYKVIEGQIGYLFPAKYKNQELPQIKKMFSGTKGIIVDMRCYPLEFMPFTFVPYVKTGDAAFVKFTTGSITNPGLFTTRRPLRTKGANDYKGKVVVIVNEQTQSAAEYTTVAFQSSPNVTVIGSTTAGADGNVSSIILPGGISTMISGIDVLYPNGTETQRKGVRIDVPISPTIAGIKAGKDELLEKAVAIINGK
jgi:C-terminal processing protease CtpA/Prc